MKDTFSDFNENSPIEAAASEWLARMDRGLTAEEQDAYTDWLTSDPAHREAIARYQMDWEDYDRLAGIHLKGHARIDPDLLDPNNRAGGEQRKLLNTIIRYSTLPLAALIVFGVYFAVSTKPEEPSSLSLQPSIELLSRIEQRTLEDGSVIEINRGSVVEAAYTESERRVYLRSGEAIFDVAKDPNRPFIVNVAGVDVRAVGTIFRVKLSIGEIGVLVTEGKVNLKFTDGSSSADESLGGSVLEVGQQAIVQLEPKNRRVEVSNLNEGEIDEVIRWRPRLLDYDSITLGELVGEFNRANPIQVAFGDPSLEAISLSSSFWSDNVEGFVRLMETSFGMKAEWIGSREIILRKTED